MLVVPFAEKQTMKPFPLKPTFHLCETNDHCFIFCHVQVNRPLISVTMYFIWFYRMCIDFNK